MSKVILYSIRDCPTCDKARHGLTDKGVDFEERSLDDNPDWWDDIQKYSSSVPIIIWGEGDVEIGWQGQHG
jgi:glutaredoxin